MKTIGIILLFSLILLGCRVARASGSSLEGKKLRDIELGLILYMKDSGGRIPRDLNDLKDYINLPYSLQPETDLLGPFPERYAFLPPNTRMDIPAQAKFQVLLLSTRPFPDGKRGAIWLYDSGELSAGMLDEKQVQAGIKGVDLANLKPMGGGVPAPSHPLMEPPITEYQANILQLAKEGKIPPPTHTSNIDIPKTTNTLSLSPDQNVVSTPPPFQMPPSTTSAISPKLAAEHKIPAWLWIVGATIFSVVIAFICKCRT